MEDETSPETGTEIGKRIGWEEGFYRIRFGDDGRGFFAVN